MSDNMNIGKINLITPPDKLFNLNPGYLLIKPSTKVKMQFQQLLSQSVDDLNVYMYDTDEVDIEWMLSVSQQADFIIIDIDNCDVRFTKTGYDEFYSGAVFDENGKIVKAYIDSHVAYASDNCKEIDKILED